METRGSMMRQGWLPLVLFALQVSALASAESLTTVKTESPYDLLVVANVNAFPKNVDGSLRLGGRNGGVAVSTCYLRNEQATPQVWRTALRNRSLRRELSSMLNVPDVYAKQGVSQFDVAAQASVREVLQSQLTFPRNAGPGTSIRFRCDDYRHERDNGAAETAIMSPLFVLPAFLSSALIAELDGYAAHTSPENYQPDQYVVIAKVALFQLRERVARTSATTDAEQQTIDRYRALAQAADTTQIGLLMTQRIEAQPIICHVAGDGARQDALRAYVGAWREQYRDFIRLFWQQRGEPQRAQLNDGYGTAKLMSVSDLNEGYLGLTRRNCHGFAGTALEVMQVHDALQRDSRVPLMLAALRPVAVLHEAFAAALGFARYADLEFSRALGASVEQTRALIAQGVTDSSAFEVLREEIRADGYAPDADVLLALTYLDDRKAGQQQGLKATQVRDRRLEQERVRAAALEARRRAEQAAFDTQYPYEIILQCSFGSSLGDLSLCFASEGNGVTTQLELRTPDGYKLYQFFELNSLGRSVRGEGVKVSVRAPFSLRAQNAHELATLTIKVRDKAKDEIVFIQSAGQFEVIRVAR